MATWYVKYRKTIRDTITTIEADSHELAVDGVIAALGQDGDVQILLATTDTLTDPAVAKFAEEQKSLPAPKRDAPDRK